MTGVVGVSPALWYFKYIASIFLTLHKLLWPDRNAVLTSRQCLLHIIVGFFFDAPRRDAPVVFSCVVIFNMVRVDDGKSLQWYELEVVRVDDGTSLQILV